ncbi:sulfatase-like hydrolase/transferase [Moraxella osloensis]|uniref:Sulfatase-like hydrolase/transferase n=1 Tax=Faucicola osloensis TaxID=34062 RepID=A0A6P1KG29_FAUOS|nr:sulfatase-like hydrolase/transferase [Moraxella osloensis]QHG09830.1 sulfatase-like hydrolase/transferase [Moraxella osloensis]
MKYILTLNKKINTLSLLECLKLILVVTLPNLTFLILAFLTATSRPLINIDYLIALLFLFLPWKLMRLGGLVLFIFAMILDTLMFLVQIFPFIDLAAIRYLSSFISIAPKIYLLMLFGFVICLIILSYLALYLSKIRARKYAIFLTIILLIISFVFMHLRISYAQFNAILGRDNYFIAHSQLQLYEEIKSSKFWGESTTLPQLMPLNSNQKRAANELLKPASNRILYIVAESWGTFKNEKANAIVLDNIFKQKQHLEFIDTGSFHTVGATVAGELRELCNLELTNSGFAFARLSQKEFKDCLPNYFKALGYKTISLHGTSGVLYDRTNWYVKAGFQEVLFGENLIGLPRCSAFKGVCDHDLMEVVVDKFSENLSQNLFFYWMTLTSHQPYAKEDIFNKRFECEKFELSDNDDLCRNARLQTQFFDDLAKLIQKPEMQGVEVIVVGDHQPPIFGYDIEHIHPLNVSYLHFKVK